MAKTTRAQGDSYTEDELADPEPPFRITRAQVGKVDEPLVGISSTQSPESEDSPEKSTTQESLPPARTMESHLDPLGTESSIVHSTDGDSRVTHPPQSGKRPQKKAAKRANVRSTTEFNEFDE